MTADTAYDGKLMDMLTGYAAAHQHPLNIAVHLVGIPTIMLGVLVPMTWVGADIGGTTLTLAHLTIAAFVLFYMSLDSLFALVFAIGALGLLQLAERIAAMPAPTAWAIAGACFIGGYVAQFIGHAIEKSMPVLVRHPIQANLAAPFFTVVEVFKLAGLRRGLFDAVQRQVASQRDAETAQQAQGKKGPGVGSFQKAGAEKRT